MTKAEVEAKRADYQRQIEALQVQAHQLSGAIADCDHWLAEIEKASRAGLPSETLGPTNWKGEVDGAGIAER